MENHANEGWFRMRELHRSHHWPYHLFFSWHLVDISSAVWVALLWPVHLLVSVCFVMLWVEWLHLSFNHYLPWRTVHTRPSSVGMRWRVRNQVHSFLILSSTTTAGHHCLFVSQFILPFSVSVLRGNRISREYYNKMSNHNNSNNSLYTHFNIDVYANELHM